jgi:hypothetical protein
VWGNIARGRGVALVVTTLLDQLPRGVRLVDVTPPSRLTIVVAWPQATDHPGVARLVDIAARLARERGWL